MKSYNVECKNKKGTLYIRTNEIQRIAYADFNTYAETYSFSRYYSDEDILQDLYDYHGIISEFIKKP